ncbi:TRAP transporter small permease [Paraglaciecola hydrolytica]|uniref:TRAP transporter small permease protein n=1 Tax=Paraglaciecola hydrolytica TaxID=1799789 RepID=A0A136A1G8_9ALTE|nr:TRAP transporter small permease [Paraglaciecola hydrolytica]KXI29071.1 C4-dicarboxylate ABC transporter permease [Paraglaciecola hydrolytica]
MNSLIKYLDKTLALALMTVMACILLCVSWQVISRYMLKDPSSVTEELARFLLIWVGMLGAVYAYRTNSHLGLNIVLDKMSANTKKATLVLIQLLVIVFSALVLVFGGYELVDLTLELKQISAALSINMGIVYMVLPISGGLLILYSLVNLSEIFNGKLIESATQESV